MSQLTRTNSSPNLKSRGSRSLQSRDFRYHPGNKCTSSSSPVSRRDSNCSEFEDQEDDFYVIGDRVLVDGYRTASVAYFGEVEFATGDWVGVVLDSPTGKHSGRIHGHEYFQCAPFHGLFVRTHRVARIQDSALGSSENSSRVSTPMPTFAFGTKRHPILRSGSRATDSKSPGASTLDSYYYDEDYRPDKRPTVESLVRKLRSFDGEHRERSPRVRTHLVRTDSLEEQGESRTTPEIPPRSSSILKSPLRNSFKHQPTIPTLTKSLDREPVFNFRPKREQLFNRKDPAIAPRSTSVSMSPAHNYSRSSTPLPGGGRASVDVSSEPPRKGDRVSVSSERGEMTGTLRFMGETEFATGEWAGVELDRPDGRNDGSILGVRYFFCPDDYGLFVPATRVKKYRPTSAASDTSPIMPNIFDSVRSTVTSPPPRLRPSHDRSTSTTPYSGTSSSSSTYLDGSRRPLSGAYSSSSLYQSDYPKSTTGYGDQALKSNLNLLNSSSSLYSRPSSSSSSYLDNSTHRPKAYDDFRPSKFDDADIEYELKRTLSKPTSLLNSTNWTGADCVRSHEAKWPSIGNKQPKSIRYTFSSSKYDGNPIARRTVEYN